MKINEYPKEVMLNLMMASDFFLKRSKITDLKVIRFVLFEIQYKNEKKTLLPSLKVCELTC